MSSQDSSCVAPLAPAHPQVKVTPAVSALSIQNLEESAFELAKNDIKEMTKNEITNVKPENPSQNSQ